MNPALLFPPGSLKGDLLPDEPLSRHTSLKVGGPADLFIAPEGEDEALAVLAKLARHNVPTLVVGGGFNLLARDGGFRGVVVSLRRLAAMEALGGGRIRVQAGAANRRLVEFCREWLLSGLEFLVGIPGTVGGALAMNAGAHGGETLAHVESITFIGAQGKRVANREKLCYGYRFLDVPPGETILSAVFRLAEGKIEEIDGRIAGFLEHRKGVQQVGFPNAGSFFKNPPGKQAWRLIDEAGLRGKRIGGAQVSEVHTNFLVNRGGATAKDFLDLAALIKEEVLRHSGIKLQEEVRIVGED